MRSFRATLAGALCAGAALPVLAVAPPACAGEGGRAALVVDTGSAVTTYCVSLPDDSVSGIELIELAGEQHGLDYSLGFGGEAVCRLEGVGPDGDDCFGEYPEFWGYWHGDGSGGWTWAGSGASSARIEDGDVDGWSWGTGDNGSSHQPPPAVEYDHVCVPAADPEPAADKERDRGDASPQEPQVVAAPTMPSPGAAPAAPPRSRPQPRKRTGARPDRDADGAVMTPSPAPSPLPARAAAARDDEEGPPVTGLLGLGAAGLLALAVWAGSRRTRT